MSQLTNQEIEKRKQIIIKNLNRGVYGESDAELALIDECKMTVEEALAYIKQNKLVR